jgi:hypothetical protein
MSSSKKLPYVIVLSVVAAPTPSDKGGPNQFMGVSSTNFG